MRNHRSSVLLWGMGGLATAWLGCGEPASSPPTDDGQVAADSYLLRVPTASAMGDLRRELSRRGIPIRHEYGDAVGLLGTVSVTATGAQARQLLQDLESSLPGLEAHADALRYPMGACGDQSCDSDEAASTSRRSTCSADCGVPKAPEMQDELQNSWHVGLVGADKVWTSSQGQGVDVAVLDTGFDRGPQGGAHPDRPKNLGWSYNFSGKNDDWTDIGGHGTHVAGIVAAAKNGTGAVGIAPEATLHVFQVFTQSGSRVTARSSDLIAAIEEAVRRGYKVVNMSLGGPTENELEHEALRKAYDAGLLLVVSAGNSEDAAAGQVLTAPGNFPGAFREALSVAATAADDSIASFSATGSTVVIAAPGQEVFSSVRVGTGARQGQATFELPDGARALAVTSPVGGSRTPLSGGTLVPCGFGSRNDVAACKPEGKVALMQRGPAGTGATPITFREKIDNARRGGAIAVLLYNHREGDKALAGGPIESITLGTVHPVPVLTMAAGDGEYLLEQMKRGPVRVSAASRISDYDRYSGTSMASPLVAGVAALIWSRYPALTNVQLRQLLVESAVDLGAPGRDDVFGWGRVDALRALQQGRPRAQCGDGTLDRESEICDSDRVNGQTCELVGWDSVAGTKLLCNSRCTGLDQSACRCIEGRATFEVSQTVKDSVSPTGQAGVLAVYNVKLAGKPVQGARARVAVKQGGNAAFTYELGPSDALGNIEDFTATEGSGLAPGAYEFAPVITKAAGRCHPDQPMNPPSYTVTIKG